MIVSHKYRFIFIKTSKTAGTSVEIGLSKFCGEADIITPISLPDEAVRKQLGYRGPQNYIISKSTYDAIDWLRFLRFNKPVFYNHMSAQGIKKYIGHDTWNNYYKFCFERHPYDRIISLYFWRHKKEPRPTMSEFLSKDGIELLKRRGRGLYTIDGEVVVDKVYGFENLAAALEDIKQRVGIMGRIELPHAKGSHRPQSADYKSLLTDSDLDRIRQAFGDEGRLMQYEF